MAKIHIGMSGWTFEGWRGDFYPKGLAQKKELAYASRQVSSIELNGTFYSLQKPASFQRWHRETPDHFMFAVKAHRFITHIKRLKEVEEPLATFLASGLLCLGEKLGPILWQFPPNVTLKDDRFEKFLKMLPFDSKKAAHISKKHSSRIDGRAFTKALGDYPLRHAFEFRHQSFLNPDFIALLREYGVAVVFAHAGGEKAPYFEDLTSDFVYARMHGQGLKQGYTAKDLHWLAERVKLWHKGGEPADAQCISDIKAQKRQRDVFVYFDTELKEKAPLEAITLSGLLKIQLPKAG